MLPTVGAETLKIIWYSSEVAGRALGIASMENLVSDPARRAAINDAGKAIAAATKQAADAFVARMLFEFVDQRVAFGRGRGVDRGFEAAVSTISETIRTSLPDRQTSNPDYRAIFPNGTEEFMSPTVKEDEDLASTLHQAVEGSSLTVKKDVLDLLDMITPIIGPAATAVRDGEKKVNTLFQDELNMRKLVVDTLWDQRKAIELALGRAGRGVARFIFFDFRTSGSNDASEAPQTPATPAPAPAAAATPAGTGEPK